MRTTIEMALLVLGGVVIGAGIVVAVAFLNVHLG
jgi:hypothetical protein